MGPCPLFLFLGPESRPAFPIVMSKAPVKQTVEHRVRELAEPLIAGEDLELLDVEYLRDPGGWILRLTIDKPGGSGPENPVGLEDCTRATRAVSTALDVEDVVPHEYSLEVSSPGVNRPLKKLEHYQRVIGQKVKVRTFGPIGDPPGRKQFTGRLVEAVATAIVVDVEGAGRFSIPLADVAKAHVQFEF